ncbi:MAG TPA: hypothetical protein VIV11_16535 [Kofleriaceae bacterium]
MKLMAFVQEFAGKPVIRLQWGKEALFFDGKQPVAPSLVTLDLPGLKGTGHTTVSDWLIAYHQQRGKSGEHTDIAEALWRVSVLDDILDTRNGSDFVWHLSTYFTLGEFADFAVKHGPSLIGDLRAAIELARKQRASALRKLDKRVERVGGALYAGTRRLPFEINELEMAEDREAVAQLGAFDAMRWIDVCASLKNDTVKRELLDKIAAELVASGGDLPAALSRMIERKLDDLYAPELWKLLGPHLQLPGNLTGEAIDLTKAREVTVTASWHVWTAKRVGPIKIGRAALMATYDKELVYVRGERKLLHSIRARGGSIQRWGNTLVVGGRKGENTVQAKLLEVERIDTLAQVDPKSAARLVGEALPDAHPITTALARAHADPTWRRILADLLIERLVGIDADVARRLARAQAGSNRRSRF